MDTPGFEDTDGPELDYANCLMINEAIGVTKNVLPVIFISYLTLREGRAVSFRKIINLVKKFIKDIDHYLDHYLNQLIFFITHCPKEDDQLNKKEIESNLSLIKEAMEK